MNRLESIEKIVARTPNDPFARYGLAMELKRLGRNDDAETAFDELEKRHPDYVAQYLMRAQLLASMQRAVDARAVVDRGIAAAQKKGDGHALGELRQLAAELAAIEEDE